ncbi:disease resistance-like protein DSC1 [Gossypium arboreum]|uniref:disease resistance-like protein DSC1 n=1 Tax=Gossypium arboreum TaxID=29729 RepID=UPI0022F1A753|nr:disease resistance-like protein DSC1 [Gossypium arboreum]
MNQPYNSQTKRRLREAYVGDVDGEINDESDEEDDPNESKLLNLKQRQHREKQRFKENLKNSSYNLEQKKQRGKQSRQPLCKLKVFNLKGSENLIKTPDFTRGPNLEVLILKGSTRLKDVHPSIGVLTRLKLLNLRGCKNLRSLPTKIEWESLETLNLKDCKNLVSLTSSKGGCKGLRAPNLEVLILEGCTKLIDVHPSIGVLTRLKLLNLGGCKNLRSLPTKIEWESLETLNLKDCKNLVSLASSKGGCKGLRAPNLEVLILEGCFSSLRELNLRECNLCDIPNDISSLTSLYFIDLSGNNFISVPSSITRLSKINTLNLDNCKELKSLPGVLTNIGSVLVSGCDSLEAIANPSNVCKSVNWADIRGINCYRLAETMNLVTLLKKNIKVFGNLRNVFTVIIPGGEIPEWFDHQRGGASYE